VVDAVSQAVERRFWRLAFEATGAFYRMCME